MDDLDKMTIAELNETVKRQLINMDILMRDVKDIKFTLIGNEMNNNVGLIKEFNDFRIEYRTERETLEERIRKTEDYQTGMKWGTRIVAFLLASGFVIQFVNAIKWIIKNVIQ